MKYINLERKIYIFSHEFEDIIMNFIDIEKINRKKNRWIQWNDYCSIILNNIINNFSSRYDMQIIYYIIIKMNYYFFLDDINNYSLRENDIIIKDNIIIKIFNNIKFSFINLKI